MRSSNDHHTCRRSPRRHTAAAPWPFGPALRAKQAAGLFPAGAPRGRSDQRSPGAVSRRDSGYTLVELLVVIALISLISVFSLPNITSIFKLSLNSATRELAGVVKEAYNASVMTGRVHRLVYDFKENTFWVESGPTSVLLDTAETEEAMKRRKRFMSAADEEKAKKKAGTPFALDRSITRTKKSLPRGVTFEDIYTERSKDPLTEGIAFTHFFPHGLTEQTVIHLKDQQNHQISLVITPLIGRTRLIERYVKPEEAYD